MSMAKPRSPLEFWITALVLIGLAAGGVWIIQYSTPIGLGLTNDSSAYLAGAQNLRAGAGYGYTSGGGEVKPLTHFPPGYSLAIAVVNLSGLEVQRAARLLNLLLFGFNVLIGGLTLGWMTRSRGAALLGGLLVVTSEVMIYVHAYLLSEPLYLAASGLALLLAAIYMENRRWPLLAAAGLLTSYAYLTRYVGLAVYGAVLVALLAALPGWKQKLRSAGIFLAFSLPGVVAWSLRNLSLTGNTTNRLMAFHPINAVEAQTGIHNFWTWWMPSWFMPKLPAVAGWWVGAALIAALVAAGTLLALKRAWRPNTAGYPARQPALLLYGLYALGYAAVILASMTFMDSSTEFEYRIIVPTLLSGILFLLGWLWQAVARRPAWLRAAALLLVAGLLLLSWQDARGQMEKLHQDGQGFLSLSWRISKTVQYIQNLPPGRIIYSNRAPVIDLLTDKTAYVLPTPVDPVTQQPRKDYAANLADLREDVKNGALVIIFQHEALLAKPENRVWIAEITQGMVAIEEFGDGIVYSAAP